MSSLKKAFFILLLIGLSGCEYVDDMPQAGRFIAKNICSGTFVEGFDETPLIEDYVTPFVPFIENSWQVEINHQTQTVAVTNSIFKNIEARALYRPPIGCVSPLDETDEQLIQQAPIPVAEKVLDPEIPWPHGSGGASPIPGVDYDQLDQVMEDVFTPAKGINAVAFLVVYDGQLVVERYEGGIGPMSPVKGFSMSKSLINGLIGRMQGMGLLSATDTTGIPEWADDDRALITLDDLMRMSSGLDFEERATGNDNHQGQLLYGDQPPFEFAVSRPLKNQPGSTFNYSSGDNIILAKIVADKLGGLQAAYDFYQTEFFHRFDAVNSLVEHDVQGHMVSAESLFMSARDWARLAQLYMNNGQWDGQQILSPDWIDYSLTPSDNFSIYGANIWLNTDQEAFPMLPEDTFAFAGALERFVMAVPSRKTIVVRLGFSHNRDEVDINPIVAGVLQALPGRP